MTKISSVTEYVEGTNTLLDRINNGKKVWIIQGSNGRRPIIADTADEAVEKYRTKKRVVDEDTEQAV